jgi:hypothetical protein
MPKEGFVSDSGTVQPDEDVVTEEPKASSPPPPGISWRRDLLGVLYGSGAFLILLLLKDALPVLVYVANLVFLPAGLWVGRASRRPWADGLVYSGFAALVVMLLLVFVGYPVWLAGPAGLLLVLPEGVLGVWLGVRFLSPPQQPK